MYRLREILFTEMKSYFKYFIKLKRKIKSKIKFKNNKTQRKERKTKSRRSKKKSRKFLTVWCFFLFHFDDIIGCGCIGRWCCCCGNLYRTIRSRIARIAKTPIRICTNLSMCKQNTNYSHAFYHYLSITLYPTHTQTDTHTERKKKGKN